MQRKFSIYCLADTMNIAQFISQTLLRLLPLVSVFGFGCSIKTTYLKMPKSEQNKLHDWWTNPFCFSNRAWKLQSGPTSIRPT